MFATRTSRRGFSLLEVLVAVALFGAVITTILAAEAGLFAGGRAAANMSQATSIARCRMTEIEEKLLRLGFPEIEEKDSSSVCCDDRDVPGYSCDWNVDRVLLPQASSMGFGGDAGLDSVLGGGLGLGGSGGGSIMGTGSSLVSGAFGQMLVNPMGGAQLDFDAGLASMGQSLQQSFGGVGAQGLLSMVFSIVYPSLKPLLEAAIRRVTVVIHWKEGTQERSFTLLQYVTNPSRAGLLAAMADAGASFDGGVKP
jgi:general secretion pathway protein I